MGCSSCNKVKRLAKSAVSVGRDIARGNYTSIEERRRRLAICRRCSYYDAKLVRCRECGCFLKQKVKFINQHCGLPGAKW